MRTKKRPETGVTAVLKKKIKGMSGCNFCQRITTMFPCKIDGVTYQVCRDCKSDD